MGRVRVGIGVLVLVVGGLTASCGRISRDVPSRGPDAGADDSSDAAQPSDAGIPSNDAADDAASPVPAPCNAAEAGALTWGETFNDTAEDKAARSNAPQGLIHCGDDLCLLKNDGALLKLTMAGDVVWSRHIGGQSTTDSFAATSLAADANGNLVLGGYCSGQPMLPAANGMKVLSGCADDSHHPEVVVARFDAAGRFLSSEALGTSDEYPPRIRVAATPDGGHAAFALVGDPASPYVANGQVVAWAADGTENYRRLFHGGLAKPSDFAFDSQGNAVLVGFFYKTTFGDASEPDAGTLLDTAGSQICVVKLTPKGELFSSRCFGGDSQDALDPTLALGPDDSIFLAGTFLGRLDFDAIGEDAGPSPTRLTAVGPLQPQNQPDIDLYVAKLTSHGDFVWQRGIGGELQQQGPYGLAVTPDGRAILDATTRGALDIGPFHVDADSSGNGFVLELDASGEPTFVTPLGKARYLDGHNSLLIEDCRDFYAAARFEGDFRVPGSNANGDVFFVTGRY